MIESTWNCIVVTIIQSVLPVLKPGVTASSGVCSHDAPLLVGNLGASVGFRLGWGVRQTLPASPQLFVSHARGGVPNTGLRKALVSSLDSYDSCSESAGSSGLIALVAEWMHFTLVGIIFPTIQLQVYTFGGLSTQQLSCWVYPNLVMRWGSSWLHNDSDLI